MTVFGWSLLAVLIVLGAWSTAGLLLAVIVGLIAQLGDEDADRR